MREAVTVKELNEWLINILNILVTHAIYRELINTELMTIKDFYSLCFVCNVQPSTYVRLFKYL